MLDELEAASRELFGVPVEKTDLMLIKLISAGQIGRSLVGKGALCLYSRQPGNICGFVNSRIDPALEHKTKAA